MSDNSQASFLTILFVKTQYHLLQLACKYIHIYNLSKGNQRQNKRDIWREYSDKKREKRRRDLPRGEEGRKRREKERVRVRERGREREERVERI